MESEGVIKFQMHWQPGPPPQAADLSMLQSWRERLQAVGAVGADPSRYGGIGFGNLSRRHGEGFLITGTQTGEFLHLQPDHYTRVNQWDIDANQVWATGPLPPSSESMTHAAVYAARSDIAWVFHAHLPELWHHAEAQGIPSTPAAVEYGTPAMAKAVRSLVATAPLPCLVRMAGHEDGMIAFGADPTSTGKVLLRAMALAARSG